MFSRWCLGWNESISWYSSDPAYGDKYRLEIRFSSFFSSPLARIIATQSYFFCFFILHAFQFGIRVVRTGVCVCHRVSVRRWEIYCFCPQPAVEMPYGLTQPIWQRSNCFIAEERKSCAAAAATAVTKQNHSPFFDGLDFFFVCIFSHLFSCMLSQLVERSSAKTKETPKRRIIEKVFFSLG